MAVYNLAVGDDLRTVQDSKASVGARIFAGALLLSNVVGPEKAGAEVAAKLGVKAIGGVIKGFTKHGLERAIERPGGAASEKAVLDAIRNPTSVNTQVNDLGRTSTTYTGKDAHVRVNPDGKIISTNPRGAAGLKGNDANATTSSGP